MEESQAQHPHWREGSQLVWQPHRRSGGTLFAAPDRSAQGHRLGHAESARNLDWRGTRCTRNRLSIRSSRSSSWRRVRRPRPIRGIGAARAAGVVVAAVAAAAAAAAARKPLHPTSRARPCATLASGGSGLSQSSGPTAFLLLVALRPVPCARARRRMAVGDHATRRLGITVTAASVQRESTRLPAAVRTRARGLHQGRQSARRVGTIRELGARVPRTRSRHNATRAAAAPRAPRPPPSGRARPPGHADQAPPREASRVAPR